MSIARPPDIPFTTPVIALTDAMDALLVVQLPPPIVEVSVDGEPGHTVVAPLIVPADTPLFTVTMAVATAVPQLFVTL